ncbi:MAG: hypothetical protein GY787_25075 [Alteromonadales bacterium]|nr:hypothetical protein [Alteromonadales bacterium]
MSLANSLLAKACIESELSIAYLRGAKFSDDIDNTPKTIKQTVSDFHQGC